MFILRKLSLIYAMVSVFSGCVLFANQPVQSPLIPRAILFGNPEKASPSISPNGRQLAYLSPVNGVLNLWVKTIDKDDDRAITHETRRGINFYSWSANDEQILYKQDRDGDENYHLYLIDLTTNTIRDMTNFPGVKASIIKTDKHFPNEVLIEMNKENPKEFDAYHLDLKTGALTLVAKNPGRVQAWLADANFEVRAGIQIHTDGTQSLLVRNDQNSLWCPVLDFDFHDSIYDELHCGLLRFSRDGKQLYLNTSLESDTRRIISFDIQTRKKIEIASDQIYDASSVIFNQDTYEPEIVFWYKDRVKHQVLDPDLQEDFDCMRALTNGDLNYINRSCDNKIWVLGFAHDNKSYEFYLFDRTTKQSKLLFRTRPQLNNYKLASMQPIAIKSRDGLNLHGYLTCPAGREQKNLPMVLLVHGGPFMRDIWDYNPEVQWLVNRGYACLQINYRGSAGYGKNFLAAGNGEWGNKMHHDLVDAVQWAIDSGISDPKRIAIYGASYGGYAALVGATFTPDLFCCAVNVFGVSSLITVLKNIPPYWSLPQWEKRIGKLSDEEFLKSRSPLFHIDKIKIPIFVVHGANDVRVTQIESEQLVAAMQAKGLAYEYLLFPDEGHGFGRPENRMTFYAAAEKFLAKNLGGRSELLHDNQDTAIKIRWITGDDLSQRQQEIQDVYFSAFKEIYKDYLTPDFLSGIESRFYTEIHDFKNSGTSMFLAVAEKENKIVGFTLFKKINIQEISLELIAIDPAHWRSGVGEKLVFAIKDILCNLKKIKTVTFKINTRSPKFYQALGFKKTDYIDTRYNAQDILGFEYEFIF